MRLDLVHAVAFGFAVSVCAGCERNANEPNREVAGSVASAPAFDASPPPMAMAVDARSVGAVAKVADPAQVNAAADAAAPTMIIRNGSASVEVDSLELAIAAVQQMATSLGGYVGNSSSATGNNEVRRATLELKIPSAKFDAALVGLKPLGKVESVESTAQDVGEEFVDMTARMTNARRLEERLVLLLATRAGKLEDVLAVERELSRVREEIERYEGRLRFLKTRVAISTLTVVVHEAAPLLTASPGDNVLLNAFKDAWRNFVRFVAGFISMLGVIIPMVVLGVLALLGWRRWIWRKHLGGVVVPRHASSSRQEHDTPRN